MILPKDIKEILPGLFQWAAYSPEHKVELTSHAAILQGKLYCFDPIPLEETAMAFLSSKGRPEAIVLTNTNHERSSTWWEERWNVPVWCSTRSGLMADTISLLPVEKGIWNGWRLHLIQGGAPGEVAFRHPEQSLVILGDAVVNLPSRGLELLPEKYCEDRQALEQSLRQFTKEYIDHLVMAHGEPLIGNAASQVFGLL